MLTGQAKKDYQREYQRKHQKEYRLRHKGLIRSNHTGSNQGVTGSNQSLKAKLEKVGLTVGSDGSLDATGLTRSPIKQESNTRIPLYNRYSKTGDWARMLDGSIVIVPERDIEGNPIYEEI